MSDPQPPAAPETDALAADFRAVIREHEYALALRTGSICSCGFIRTVEQGSLRAQQDYFADHLAEVIADSTRERLREVESERDAARADAAHADHVTDTLVERAQRIGMSVRAADPSRYAGWTEDQWAADAVAIMDSIDGSCADLVNGHVHALMRRAARAESAEAAHEALRAGVEALTEKWDKNAAADMDVESKTLRSVATYLRALLAGGAR